MSHAPETFAPPAFGSAGAAPSDDTPVYARRLSATLRRLVVVGLGSIGRRHARLLAERSDISVELCDPSTEALQRAQIEIGVRPAFQSLDAALATHPHAVVIATPHELHASQTIAAMQTGADVFCEKPLCLDPGEARRVILSARETGRKLGVGFQLHFHPGVQRMRRLIRAGTLGGIVHLHARVGSYITLRNSASRYQKSLRGALFLDYAHQPDLIFWLLERLPTAVTMTGLQAGVLPLTSNPNVMALSLEYGGTMLATVHLNYVQMPQRHEWEVVGEKGWILMDADRGILRLGSREAEAETRETIPVDRDDTYRHEHQSFLDCLDGLRAPESTAEDAARSVELFAMAMRSLEEGRRIPCEWQDY